MNPMTAGKNGKAGSNQTNYSTQNLCGKCSKPLTLDEIAATRKLINRGATTWFCVDCLAKAFDVTAEDIEKKISYFKEIGCTLFSTDNQSYKLNGK